MATRHLATGDFAGHLMLWYVNSVLWYRMALRPSRDLERTEIPIYDVKAHGEIINAIDGCGMHPACAEKCDLMA